MAESSGRRMFHEDIFAEDNEKFSWQPLGRSVSSLTNEVTNYNVHAGRGKDSSKSPSSEEDSVYRGDSNSLKRSFRKRSSSASDGNIAEDTSSSQRPIQVIVPRERVLPSIYDDDARSGSPSGIFERKDLAFQSSFKKDFNIQSKGFGNSSLYAELEANRTVLNQDREDYTKDRHNNNQSSSPHGDRKKDLKEKTKNYRSRSRSSSREILQLESKSRSASRERRNGSQNRSRDRPFDRYSKTQKSLSPGKKSPDTRRRSRSPDTRRRSRSPGIRRKTRSPDLCRKTRSPDSSRRTRSPDLRRRTRSPDSSRRTRSPDTRRRTRSPISRKRSTSRDSRKRSDGRSIRKRSRSRDTRRRSRSRSYERRRRSRRSSSRDRYRRRRYSRSRSRSRDRGSSSRKPGSLPLSTSGGAMTPQMALQQTMAAMSAKAQAMTGIALPKYYNPAAVNPLKYAEQVQKRKLLWQTKEKEDEQPKNTVWDKLTFEQDQDGKMTAKFRKLMGIKSEGGDAPESEKESVLKKQAELFRDLDQQYEMARVTTHTQRGVGLGYSATTLYPPIQK